MLKKTFLVVVALIVVCAGAFALDEAAIEQSDALYEDDQPQAAFDILEGALSTANNGSERAEVLWRMARATLDIAELEEDKGGAEGPILEMYERGEQYGIEAAQADPSNHLGYYWQSANIGKWGQLKGILNSLFKAGPMRDLLQEGLSHEPNHADSYYVLGQLYEQVPGSISFGNKDYAVGLGRLSIDLHEAELESGVEDEVNHDFYVQMAAHLLARDWNEGRRSDRQSRKRRDYNDADDPMERGFYYEGVIDIPAQSDEEEATDILRWVIDALEDIPDRSDGQNRQLDEARELWASL